MEFARELSDLSRDRDIVWISNEGKGVVAGLADRAPADTRNGVVGRVLFRKGHRSDEVLALAHPHGASLTWLRDMDDELIPNPESLVGFGRRENPKI